MGGQSQGCKSTDIKGIVSSFGKNLEIIDEFRGSELKGKKLIDVINDIMPSSKAEQEILEGWKRWFRKNGSPYIVIEVDRNTADHNGLVRKHALVKEKTGNRRPVEPRTGPAVMSRTGKPSKRANPDLTRVYR